VLVATDIAARGIDVNALGHVVNFDVPLAPEDYIHRVGRTGRAELTGEAFTLVSPEEEGSLRDIERALGRRLPRVMVPDLDYTAKPKGGLEIPLAQRLVQIRTRKREERARQQVNAARRSAVQRGHSTPVRAGQPGQSGQGATEAGSAVRGPPAGERRAGPRPGVRRPGGRDSSPPGR
jgi:ATP-dependent RNA helicase RhlE